MITSARIDKLETIAKAGLDVDLASAQKYLGLAPANPTRPLSGVPEPNEPERIRFFGRPSTLIGVIPGIDEPSSGQPVTFENRGSDWTWNSSRFVEIVILSLLMGILLVTTLSYRNRWINALGLAMALGAVGSAGGPLILAGGLGVAVIGWRTSGR
jgi:hypothetical protein